MIIRGKGRGVGRIKTRREEGRSVEEGLHERKEEV